MVKRFTRIVNFFLGCLVVALVFSGDALAQISLNPFTKSYTQDFNTLPSSGTGVWEHGTSYIPGWFLFRTAPVTTTLTAGTGSHNAGGLYSFGLAGSTDRALGSIASASKDVGEFAWGLMIQNNTGQTITSLNISFTGEQWRSARAAAPQHMLSFWYATGADPAAFNLSPKSDAGWINVKELDFKGPVFYAAGGALNGNDPANKRYLSTSIPVTIPDKGYVMLRWKDLDEFENDHGLAIDDFSLTWSTDVNGGPTILPVELVNFKATSQSNAVQLQWATASEKNNSHFIVERSQDSKDFRAITTVEGKGTSATRTNYSFTDEDPLQGLMYYRLKQVDVDGSFTYSKTIAVKVQPLSRAILYPTITSDLLYLDVPETTEHTLTIVDLAGMEIYNAEVAMGERRQVIEVGRFRAGTYSLLLVDKSGLRQVFRFVKR
ncbi:fibronectin type III domain-containing protein [Pontibacter pudoricolor]|uniref:T9SS C-terminal target domain-containing protein n=1 Tax=Pontibacter pudoricolor TaxID=2694930 RepID=UPI001390CA45|nr:T9SS C-terminal target domain-containing protein [Pontibacter pudoricolor]